MAGYSKKTLLTALAVVILYLLSLKLGLLLGLMNSDTLFWPASGIALAVLLVSGLVLAVSNHQRKRINQSLKSSEAELKRVQAIAKIGSWQLDITRNDLRWSDETSRIFGFQPGSARNIKSFFDRVHPDDRALVLTAWQAALRDGTSEIEHRILVDGKIKKVQERAEVDFDRNGHAVSASGTVRNITAMRETEARLNLAARVFASSGEAIMITDKKGRIVAVNPAFTSMTEYTEAELLGKNPRVMASGLHDKEFFREMWDAIHATGKWQGEIWDRGKNGRIYPKWTTINLVKDEHGNPTNYISAAIDITERKSIEKNIHFLAYYDVLTGLANRALLHDRLYQVMAAAHRDRQKFSLLFLDIDRFKYINDSLGHAMGDRLLQFVARRLMKCVREGDTVSRIGGDEFVVLLRETDQSGAVHVAEKILKSLADAYEIEGTQISTYASIGISVYPTHAGDIDTLIRNAEMAMYHAKSEGRNNCQFYTEEMNLRTTHMFAMEKDIRLALERNEFSLRYQPQVDLRNGGICGMEVLLSWQHPEMGCMSPADFIAVAEETGQIMLIGEWVLHAACTQLAAWRKQGMARFPMAVNLSIRQLRQPNLAKRIASMLEQFQLHPGDLELELTEGIMMENSELAMTFMTQMHELGVHLSIDDFGTGFSSLSYLKRLPIDKLKIDQSFVHDIEIDDSDAAIVRSIISLGHRLGLGVIAEGVETLEQLDFLRICGCDQMQGYYFSRPLVADEFIDFVSRNPKLNFGAA
ncbi:MAG: EAL domain-containing protein [Gallionellaceae bacterium]